MSYVNTVLKPDTLAAMPAMNEASRPVTATPSTPLGSRSRIKSGIALLYCRSPVSAPSPSMVTSAMRPGMTVTSGMKIFGYAAMIGVRRAALMFFADSARWTSAKLVVQYPNESTKPRPNTMPSQCAPSGLSVPPVSAHACRPGSPRSLSRTLSNSPSMPPTLTRPMTTIGMSPARITKNWSTSL
jgi:hypothetical protein